MKLESEYKVVAPTEGSIDTVIAAPVHARFSDETIAFVGELSSELMRDARTSRFPEIIALAYWLRKANVKRMQSDFESRIGDQQLLPRGLAFHIAPSNVDTIFVYSLFISLFCGNKNIVRLSSTPNEQVDSILEVMNGTLKTHPELARRILIVRYEHSEELTTYFSSLCNIRMIWGGDETIRRIRQTPVPPRAKELTFADRFSMAVIDSAAYLEADDTTLQQCTEGFYNDSFWFHQMACSSPRMVCWLGDDESTGRAQALFWERVSAYVLKKNPDTSAAAIMDKLVAECSYAVESDSGVNVAGSDTQLVSRVHTTEVNERFREIHCGNGLFLEMKLQTLEDLTPLLDTKVQTLACFGIDKACMTHYLNTYHPAGVDRCVPFGEALDFAYCWDGYNLLDEMCRSVDVKLPAS